MTDVRVDRVVVRAASAPAARRLAERLPSSLETALGRWEPRTPHEVRRLLEHAARKARP